MISYIALAVGTAAALCTYAIAGRLAGLSATGLWIVGTAYFLMAPVHSLRVSSTRDLAALAVYGAVGLVLAKTAPKASQPVQDEFVVPRIGPRSVILVDLKTILSDLMSSSEMGQLLKPEITISAFESLRSSRGDAIRVLAEVLSDAVSQGQPSRLSIHVVKRPGVDVLIVNAHKVWPPPLLRTMTIGKRDDECNACDFFDWPPHVRGTWFDNGFCRIYQISFRSPGCDAP